MKTLSLLIVTLALTNAAFAQSSESSDVDQLEGMFKDEQTPAEPPPSPKTETLLQPARNLGQVRKLEPYSDIAVIQRRFLPKSGRFEVFGGGGLIMNDTFFNNIAMDLRVGYNFSEAYGLELIGMSISTADKDVTKELQTNKQVTTETLVSPMGYLGGAFKWSPWYGKISWLNRSIIPFDHYFLIGGGNTTTNQHTSAGTAHLGMGQIFALTKRFAFRWDLSWMFYNTTSNVGESGGDASYNNLYLTVGMSWFFPEATYR